MSLLLVSVQGRQQGPVRPPGHRQDRVWVVPIRNQAVDGAIVGFRRPNQVDPILVAANLELDEDDMATIERRV